MRITPRSIILRHLFLPAFFVIAGGCLFAADLYVPDNYTTIQDAINASVDGDRVIVRPGTYKERIDFLGKAITVMAEKDYTVTVIDGNLGAGVVKFQSGEGPDSILEGFSIQMGMSMMGQGGIVCSNSSPTINDNSIVANISGGGGGGIFCDNASPMIYRNNISGNMATTKTGGGISCTNGSAPSVINNTFVGNVAQRGGGVYCDASSAPTLVNNYMANNMAGDGAAVYSDQSSLTFTNNTVIANTAQTEGGGFYQNGPGGASVITNTIFWDNSAPTNPEIGGTTTGITMTFCDVEGGFAGTGNINADPEFVDPTILDGHIKFTSPCRDTGSNAAPGLPSDDFEGDPRPAGAGVDMGCDEFHTHLYFVGCDLKPGDPFQLRVIGTPNASPVIVAVGSGVQDPPQTTPYGLLYLAWPIQQATIGSIGADGVLIVTATIPLSWIPGNEYPVQCLVGPLGNPASVLTNLILIPIV